MLEDFLGHEILALVVWYTNLNEQCPLGYASCPVTTVCPNIGQSVKGTLWRPWLNFPTRARNASSASAVHYHIAVLLPLQSRLAPDPPLLTFVPRPRIVQIVGDLTDLFGIIADTPRKLIRRHTFGTKGAWVLGLRTSGMGGTHNSGVAHPSFTQTRGRTRCTHKSPQRNSHIGRDSFLATILRLKFHAWHFLNKHLSVKIP